MPPMVASPKWSIRCAQNWLLPADRSRRTLPPMTTQRTSPLLAGPDGRALLASSLLARLPLAMLSIALLVHVQRLTGSFAIAGAACSAYAICGALASPVLGRLVDRRGQTGVLVIGGVLTALALIG